jgi:hypothetical protein
MASYDKETRRDGKARRWVRAVGYQAHAYLEPEYREKLERLLRRRGLSFAAWLRDRIDAGLRERIPESQGGVALRLSSDDEEILFFLHRLAQREAEGLRAALAATPREPSGPAAERRAALRREADAAYAAASWCHDLLEAYRYRRHLLDAGMRAPRHRTKASSAPPAASSALTTASPTG